MIVPTISSNVIRIIPELLIDIECTYIRHYFPFTVLLEVTVHFSFVLLSMYLIIL